MLDVSPLASFLHLQPLEPAPGLGSRIRWAGEAPDTEMPTSRSTPTLAPPPPRSSGGGLPRGRARSCSRARVLAFPSSPAEPRRREGAEWGVVGALGRLLRVPAEAAAAGAAEAAEAGVPLPSLTSGFWP